jgi:hypothetical protein
MNECSFSAATLSSEPFAEFIDQCLIERFTTPGLDDLHHVVATQRGADWIDVQMKMRRSDTEFQQDGSIGAGRGEERCLGPMMSGREVSVFDRAQIRDVLDMGFPNDHGVPADSPIVVQDDKYAAIVEEQLAGLARVVAENARHGQ